MSELPKFTRREFLISSGCGVLTSLAAKPIDKGLRAISDVEKLNNSGLYLENQGVYVRGGDILFEDAGKHFQTSLNHQAFNETATYLSKRLIHSEKFNDFLNIYPLRVALHEKIRSKDASAQYSALSIKNQPEIKFTTDYLRQYKQISESDNEHNRRIMDSVVVHEMIHLWQDATDNMTNLIDSTLQTAPLFISASNSMLLSAFVVTESIKKHPQLHPRRHVVKGVAVAIPVILMGGVVSTKIKPSLQEKQADHYDNILVDLPEFQKFRGQYFNFEQVDN